MKTTIENTQVTDSLRLAPPAHPAQSALSAPQRHAIGTWRPYDSSRRLQEIQTVRRGWADIPTFELEQHCNAANRDAGTSGHDSGTRRAGPFQAQAPKNRAHRTGAAQARTAHSGSLFQRSALRALRSPSPPSTERSARV